MNKSVSELIHSGFISENQLQSAENALKTKVEDLSAVSEKLGCLFQLPSKWDLRLQHSGINEFPDILYSGSHPSSASLMDKLAPVAKQNKPIPSPAAAVTALLEFYCSGGKEKLSEEFLYRKCKEMDNIPAAGTLLETAFDCAEKFGICKAALMQKIPEEKKAQGVVSEKLLADAGRHRLPHSYRKLENFDDIDQYKELLSGSNAMPVVVGIDVFKSWFFSAFTQKSGWISLPLPYDERLGGLALLIVGYRDSKYVAGGGYFIARNSWGADWASQSDCPGYARIPYAYMLNYVRFAGTIGSAPSSSSLPPEEKKADVSENRGKKDCKAEKEDFISEEQYEEAVKAVVQTGGEYVPGGKTGCRLDENRGSTKCYFRFSGYQSGGSYPAEISLVPWMPPVYDQGERGTCAAMAITALAEYYEGCRKKLSQQYLYCKCKEFEYKAFQAELAKLLRNSPPGELLARLDNIFKSFVLRGSSQEFASKLREMVLDTLRRGGKDALDAVFSLLSGNYMAFDNGGTTLDIAMECLDESGICQYDIWPYQPEPIEGNEGQFLSYPDSCAPEDAEKEARKHRLRDDFKMIYPPNCIDAYKAVLAGANGNRPMPVAIGAETFASWTNSPFARKTGWISMPLATDKNTGGHAMLVVGYKDSPKVPGGGYFIVRNSWGTKWAYGAQAPGYAKMPYKYVEKFVRQAATIIQKQEDAPEPVQSTGESSLDKYLSIASCDMKDSRGIWSIAKGTWVITDPVSGVSEPDTAENRRIFLQNNFSWKKTAAVKEVKSAKLDPSVDKAVGIMNNFCAVLDSNLRDLSSTYCFPGINLPLSARLKPWQLRVKKAELIEDISEPWVKMQIDAGVLSAKDEECAKSCNSFRIYELKNGSALFRVAVIFISPVADGKRLEKVDNQMFICAKKMLRKYQDECCRFSPASATFCVIGSASAFCDQIKAEISHDTIDIIVQRPDMKYSWDIQFPPVKATPVWFKFVEHLLPMNATDRQDLIQSTVDRIADIQMGAISLPKIAEESHWPLEMVWQEVIRLCRKGGYKYAHGEVLKVKDGKPQCFVITPWGVLSSFAFGFYNNFIGACFVAIGWKLFVRPDMSNRYQIGTIAGLGLCSYIGSCLNVDKLRKVINIRKES